MCHGDSGHNRILSLVVLADRLTETVIEGTHQLIVLPLSHRLVSLMCVLLTTTQNKMDVHNHSHNAKVGHRKISLQIIGVLKPNHALPMIILSKAVTESIKSATNAELASTDTEQ